MPKIKLAASAKMKDRDIDGFKFPSPKARTSKNTKEKRREPEHYYHPRVFRDDDRHYQRECEKREKYETDKISRLPFQNAFRIRHNQRNGKFKLAMSKCLSSGNLDISVVADHELLGPFQTDLLIKAACLF